MGGKGEPSVDQNAINQAAYTAGAGGQKWNDIQGAVPQGGNPQMALDSWLAGQQSVVGSHPAGFHFPSGGGSHGASSGGDQSITYEQQLADQQRLVDQQAADAERIAGENNRDQLYSAYMDAAGSSTDFVNSEIDREKSNAALLGVDYTMTDELKTTRINDYFASVWGEGEQQNLEALMGQWGNPQGFSGFSVVRGDASQYAGTEGEEKTVGQSKGVRPTLVTEEEEVGLGGGQSVLGV